MATYGAMDTYVYGAWGNLQFIVTRMYVHVGCVEESGWIIIMLALRFLCFFSGSHLLRFMNKFYELNNQLGNASEEKTLAACVIQLEEATSEPLVKFLHLTPNNLCALLVRPTVTAESGEHVCVCV